MATEEKVYQELLENLDKYAVDKRFAKYIKKEKPHYVISTAKSEDQNTYCEFRNDLYNYLKGNIPELPILNVHFLNYDFFNVLLVPGLTDKDLKKIVIAFGPVVPSNVIVKYMDNPSINLLTEIFLLKDNFINCDFNEATTIKSKKIDYICGMLNVIEARLTQKQWQISKEDLIEPIKLFLTANKDHIVDENEIQSSIMIYVKKLFPIEQWKDFLPLLPLLPQKKLAKDNVMNIIPGEIIGVCLDKEDLYNKYDCLIQKKDYQSMIVAVTEAMKKAPGVVNVTYAYGRLNKDSVDVLLYVNEKTSEQVETLAALLNIMLDSYNENANKENVTPLLETILQAHILEKSLPSKEEVKKKKVKI
jgi:hypothetical protein